MLKPPPSPRAQIQSQNGHLDFGWRVFQSGRILQTHSGAHECMLPESFYFPHYKVDEFLGQILINFTTFITPCWCWLRQTRLIHFFPEGVSLWELQGGKDTFPGIHEYRPGDVTYRVFACLLVCYLEFHSIIADFARSCQMMHLLMDWVRRSCALLEGGW